MGAHLSKPRSFKSGGRKYGLFRKPVTDRGRISGWAYMESLKMGNPAQECFDYAGGYNSPNFVLRSRVVSCAYTRLWSFDLARCHHKIPRITKTPGGVSLPLYVIYTLYILLLFVLDTYTLWKGVTELLVILVTPNQMSDCFVPHSGYVSVPYPVRDARNSPIMYIGRLHIGPLNLLFVKNTYTTLFVPFPETGTIVGSTNFPPSLS